MLRRTHIPSFITIDYQFAINSIIRKSLKVQIYCAEVFNLVQGFIKFLQLIIMQLNFDFIFILQMPFIL